MATIFPISPAPQVNDEFQGYRYNGTSWEIIGIDLTVDYQPRVANVSDTEVGYLDGVTSAIQTQLNDKSTASKTETLTNKTLTTPKINEDVTLTSTSTELNVLDGITASTAELNIMDGVTSTATELNILDGATLTTTELNYVDGVTSAIQTQLNTKALIADPTFTGTVTTPIIRVTATDDASLSSTGHGLQVGLTNGTNIAVDGNEIMARNNGAASTLFLNNDGGDVSVGVGGISTTGGIRANSAGADGGPVLRAWTANSAYTGLATANMTSAEYNLITDGTDTFISGGAGGSTTIRGGNNSTTAQVQVTPSVVNVTGDLNTNYINANTVISATTVDAAGRGLHVRQAAGNAGQALIQFTDNAVTAQRASISADSSGNLSLNSTRAFWFAIQNNTVAGQAVVVTSDGQLRRTSSSEKYKNSIEDLNHDVADRVLNLRPVWFKANETNVDNPEEWSYVGLIAEEVAQVEPRLALFKKAEPVYDEFGNQKFNEDGSPEMIELEIPEPEGVKYAELSVYLLDVVKREKARSNELEQRIVALEELLNNG
jgi:hypothetical protein